MVGLTDKRIILASLSPRRKQLMEMMGLEFDVVVSNADESASGSGGDQAALLARRKASAVASVEKSAVVIGADTIVEIDGRLLGKPADAREAFEMLNALQGREHLVHTGVAIINDGKTKVFVETTTVHFRALNPKEIKAYIACGESFDKAGAYGIQGRGATLVERIEGDFYAVIGLPVARLWVVLNKILTAGNRAQ